MKRPNEVSQRRTLRLGIFCLAVVVLLQPGCYRYTAAGFDEPSPETHVRVNLSRERVLELEDELGAVPRWIDGEVLERDPDRDAILLSVPRSAFPDRLNPESRLRQRIWLENRDVLQMEVRRLDRRRTGALVTALGAAAGALVFRALGLGSVDTETGPPGGEVP